MATRAQMEAEIDRLQHIPGVYARSRLLSLAAGTYELHCADLRIGAQQQLRGINGTFPGKWSPTTVAVTAALVRREP